MRKEVYVSAREFATYIGRSNVWVSAKVKEGIFPVNQEKLLPLEQCKAIYKALIAQRAIKESKESKNQESVRDKRQKKPKKPPKTDKTRIEDVDSDLNLDGLSAEEISRKYSIAKANEKTALAGLRSLELRLKESEILERSEVEADASRTAAFMRNALLSLPARYAALVCGKTQREVQEILENAVEEVLQSLQKAEFVK